MASSDPAPGASIGELLQRLAADTALLVRQEIALVQAELTQKAKSAMRPAVLIGIGVILAAGAFGAGTMTLIAAIALAIPLWAAALMVTLLYVIIAALTVRTGIAGLRRVGNPLPQATITSVREDVEAVRAGVKRGL